MTKKRGTKSAADKTADAREKLALGLPQPPSHLDADEAKEWTAIVSRYPVDRFPRSTWPMLENYCVLAVLGRAETARYKKAMKDDEASFSELRAMRSDLERTMKTLASFGVRLGFARTSLSGRHNNDPDSTNDPDPAPWED
jgi:phage terminase small subunit